MPDFDLSKVPPEIAKLLMSRGSGTLALQYVTQQNLMAKKTLDMTEISRLFGDLKIREPRHAAGVRALLYLYTGWGEDAIQQAVQAGGAEQTFITAVAERHLVHADAAKKLFQQLGPHTLFATLYDRAQQMLRTESDPQIKRFRDIIEMNKAWEPFAFIDLYEQTRVGKLSPVGEQAICKLQDLEFELIFNHCFLGATGHVILKHRVISEADEQRREQEYRKKMIERREREERQRKSAEAKKAIETESQKPKSPPAPPPSPKAKVLCPKCGTLVYVDESLRGKPARCFKCNAVFLVPKKKSEAAPARAFAPKGPSR